MLIVKWKIKYPWKEVCDFQIIYDLSLSYILAVVSNDWWLTVTNLYGRTVAKHCAKHFPCIISFHFYWDSSRWYPHFTATDLSFNNFNHSSKVIELTGNRAKVREQVCFIPELLAWCLAVSSLFSPPWLLSSLWHSSLSHTSSTAFTYFQAQIFWPPCSAVCLRAVVSSAPGT